MYIMCCNFNYDLLNSQYFNVHVDFFILSFKILFYTLYFLHRVKEYVTCVHLFFPTTKQGFVTKTYFAFMNFFVVYYIFFVLCNSLIIFNNPN